MNLGGTYDGVGNKFSHWGEQTPIDTMDYVFSQELVIKVSQFFVFEENVVSSDTFQKSMLTKKLDHGV